MASGACVWHDGETRPSSEAERRCYAAASGAKRISMRAVTRHGGRPGVSLRSMSNAPHEDDGLRYAPRPTGPGVGDPAAMAIAALVLGTLSLGGLGLLNGSNYVLPFTEGQSDTTRTVLAGLLGALMAFGAVILGLMASRRAHPGDPSWVPRIAQAGVLVAGVAVVLRLVATSAAAVQVAEAGFFSPL